MFGEKGDHVRPQTFDVLFGQVLHHAVGGEYPLDRCLHQQSPNNREYGRVDLKFHIGTRRICAWEIRGTMAVTNISCGTGTIIHEGC